MLWDCWKLDTVAVAGLSCIWLECLFLSFFFSRESEGVNDGANRVRVSSYRHTADLSLHLLCTHENQIYFFLAECRLNKLYEDLGGDSALFWVPALSLVSSRN